MSTNGFGGDEFSREDGATGGVADETDRPEVSAHIERLTEENRRLREKNERLRNGDVTDYRSRYRRLGLGLALLGTVAALGGAFFPGVRSVLFATAATGLFGGLLTYTLSDGRFVTASVCDRIYAAAAANEAALIDELGYADDRIYVPDGDGQAYLFVPRRSESEVPETVDDPSTVTDRRGGTTLESTGMSLLREVNRTTTDPLQDSPPELAARLADVLVEQFELAGGVETSVEDAPNATRLTVTVSDSVLGDVGRFDHPIASFFAVGLAINVARPVVLEGVVPKSGTEWRLRYRWDSFDEGVN